MGISGQLQEEKMESWILQNAICCLFGMYTIPCHDDTRENNFLFTKYAFVFFKVVFVLWADQSLEENILERFLVEMFRYVACKLFSIHSFFTQHKAWRIIEWFYAVYLNLSDITTCQECVWCIMIYLDSMVLSCCLLFYICATQHINQARRTIQGVEFPSKCSNR